MHSIRLFDTPYIKKKKVHCKQMQKVISDHVDKQELLQMQYNHVSFILIEQNHQNKTKLQAKAPFTLQPSLQLGNTKTLASGATDFDPSKNLVLIGRLRNKPSLDPRRCVERERKDVGVK